MNDHSRLDYEALSDLELASRVAARDERAVRLVTRRNNQTLFRAAWSILRNRDEAEDAVQTAYLRAFVAIGGFQRKASLSTWLTRITINAALERLRSIRRKRSHVEGAEDLFRDDYRERLHASAAPRSPDQCVAQAQLGRMLETAIDGLPVHLRTAFVLREIEDLDVAEVAEILGISPVTVRTRHFRARRHLRQALAPGVGDALTAPFPFAGLDCEIVTAWVVEAWCGRSERLGRIETRPLLRPMTDRDRVAATAKVCA